MKKSISADTLGHVVFEELSHLYANGKAPAVAIVPIADGKWATLTSHKARRSNPQLAAQIAKIEKKLRQRYRLEKD